MSRLHARLRAALSSTFRRTILLPCVRSGGAVLGALSEDVIPLMAAWEETESRKQVLKEDSRAPPTCGRTACGRTACGSSHNALALALDLALAFAWPSPISMSTKHHGAMSSACAAERRKRMFAFSSGKRPRKKGYANPMSSELVQKRATAPARIAPSPAAWLLRPR